MPRSREILLPWDSQPQEVTQASGVWARRGLIGLWNFADGGSGTIGGPVTFSSIPPDVDISSSGVGYKNPSISSSRPIYLPDLSASIGATNEVTLVLILSGGNTTTQGLCNLGGTNNTTQSDHYPYRPASADLIYSSIFKSSRWVSGITSKVDHTKPHVVSVQFKNGRQRYAQAGIELAVATAAVNPIWPSWARLLVSDAPAYAYSGAILGAAVFNAYIEDAELFQITKSVSDAWQLYAPQTIPVPVSAGVSGTSVNPGAGAVAISGYAPTVGQTAHVALTPGAGTVGITGYAPTVTQGGAQAVDPGVGTVTLTGYAPSVAQSANVALAPDVGALTVTGYAPSVVQATGSPSLVPGVGALTITGFAPSVEQSVPAAAQEASYPA
jgi:hypothetical protein